MKRSLFFLFSLLFWVSNSEGKVKLSSVLGNHMVLQQHSLVKLSGRADLNATVKIITSWDNKTYLASVEKDGTWNVEVVTQAAGGPYTITFNDGDLLTLCDIYLGEVWLCSGQSNMAMPMKGFGAQPVFQSNEVIANVDERLPIRLFTVERAASKTRLDECKGDWKLHTSENVADFSATAYFFGYQLYRSLHVPIGLIQTSWGGSKIESWMSPESLDIYPEISRKHLMDNVTPEQPHRLASMLYNAMLYPLKDVCFKGWIWYQGEANRNDADLYQKLLCTFVEDWRTLFKKKDLPFYYVQIAPFDYKEKPLSGALLREAQFNCEKKIPHSGMTVLMDAGDSACIHPAHKQKAGERLAYWALSKTYEKKAIGAASPRYVSKQINGSKVTLFFENAFLGLTSYGETLSCFEVAGEDGVYYQAEARIVNKSSVEVWSKKVVCPAAVRYAFKDYVKGDLYGTNGLPVSSFRTEPHF